MKAVLICGGIIVGLVAVVLAVAHGKRMCRYATAFLEHFCCGTGILLFSPFGERRDQQPSPLAVGVTLCQNLGFWS